MSKVQRFCPSCFGNEVVVNEPLLVGAGEGKAHCPLCAWKGKPSELYVGAQGDQWDGERIARLLLHATTKHAAGPMLSLFEHIGLVPKLAGSPLEQASAEAIRAEVVKAIIEAVVTTGFETAVKLTASHYARFDQEKAEETRRVFSFAEAADEPS